jgi:hypothetical protein
MARIREAYIAEDGEIHVRRARSGGGWRLVLAVVLLAGGVWMFDQTYGDGRATASEQSDVAPN